MVIERGHGQTLFDKTWSCYKKAFGLYYIASTPGAPLIVLDQCHVLKVKVTDCCFREISDKSNFYNGTITRSDLT